MIKKPLVRFLPSIIIAFIILLLISFVFHFLGWALPSLAFILGYALARRAKA